MFCFCFRYFIGKSCSWQQSSSWITHIVTWRSNHRSAKRIGLETHLSLSRSPILHVKLTSNHFTYSTHVKIKKNTQNTEITITVQVHCTIGRGGTFSQSLVLQAFSDVMVIIDEVSNLQRGHIANSGPHPAILLLTSPIEKWFSKVFITLCCGVSIQRSWWH